VRPAKKARADWSGKWYNNPREIILNHRVGR
jgi:hypothetical protein